ncbi:MAG: hypothetical protein H0W61_02435 [Bacteroidetes bacterium]|nr:hypothetical protein [Bacteroidota bacterium]
MKSIVVLSLFISLFFFRSRAQDLGGQWKYVGPKESSGQVKGLIKSVWVDPLNSSFVLAGSCSGGLFKTTNANAAVPDWENISDTYNGMSYGISDIVVKPNASNKIIYVATGHNSGLATGYGNGILKTYDGGKNWQEVGPKARKKNLFMMEGLVANPQNPSEMLAYTARELFITRDEWNTFEKIALPIDTTNTSISICDAEFAPFEPGKFYICTRTYNFYEPKLFVCNTYGGKIEDITPKDVKAERIEVATIQQQKFKGKFYAALGTGDVFVTFYNGEKYSILNTVPINHTFGGSFWNLEMGVNQVDTTIIYVCLTEISRSRDGGKTFEKIGAYNGRNTHADVRGLMLSQSTRRGKNDVLVIANDGGLSRLDTTEGVNWINLNGNGLNVNQFWGASVAQDDSLLIVGGVQDNGGFILTAENNINTMYSCGDGYLGLALDKYSGIIECNPPSLFYHNLKTKQDVYLQVNESQCETRRPLELKDSFVYAGYQNIWRINKYKIGKGESVFSKFTEMPVVKYDNETRRNNSIKCMSFGEKKCAIIAYANPNWSSKENIGKIFFSENINAASPEWKDITPLVSFQTLEICRWFEVSAIEVIESEPVRFCFAARDVFDQSNTLLFMAYYYPDSNRCDVKKINSNLPPVGINKILTDKFSGLTYIGCDDGVYYSSLDKDTVIWKKLNGNNYRLPAVMVNDLSFNYANNTLVAATYGRGVWQTTPVIGLNKITEIKSNQIVKEPFKIDGKLIVARKKILILENKLILTNGSVIELKKGSTLIISNKNLLRDENNKLIDLDTFIHKTKGAKVIYR